MRRSLRALRRRVARAASRLLPMEGMRRPALTLLSGSASAAALSFVMQPVLARLYGPEEFGVLSYFMALLSVVATISSLQYESALMQPDSEDDVINIIWLSFLILGATTLLLSLAVPWRSSIARALGMPEIGPWLVLLPPALLGHRLLKLIELWFVRSKRFELLSGGQFINSAVATGFRTAAALPPFYAGAVGLLGGVLAGQFAVAAFYVPLLVRSQGRTLTRAFDLTRLRAVARQYRDFTFFSTPASTLNTLLSRLPFLLIPLFFLGSSEAVLGHLGQAINVLAVPLGFIGNAVAQVFFAHAADASRSGRLHIAAERVHARLVAVGLFPTLLLVVAGPDILGFILGSDWREAGLFARFISPWIFLSAVAAPLTRIFDVLERQRLDLLTSAGMFVGLTAALIVGGAAQNVTFLLAILGFSGALVRSIHVATMLSIAHVPLAMALRPYRRGFSISAPLLLLVATATAMSPGWLTAMVSLVAAVVYYSCMLATDFGLRGTDPSETKEAELPSGNSAS